MAKRNKKHARRLRNLVMVCTLCAVVLTVSTYAWFTSQKDITLSNLRGTVEVAENMEISLDAKVSQQEIDLSNAKVVFDDAQDSKDDSVSGTAKAILPAQLLPVSGVGEKGSKILPLYTGNAKGTTLENIEKCIQKLEFEKAKELHERLDKITKITEKQKIDLKNYFKTEIFSIIVMASSINISEPLNSNIISLLPFTLVQSRENILTSSGSK